MRPVMVGVAGGSGSGKSTLCRLLARRAPQVTVLELDAYYRDRSSIGSEERSRVNYDQPEAFDVTLLIEHVASLAAGNDILKPQYCFKTHARTGGEMVTAAQVVLIEGLFTLWWPEVRAWCDLTVFVDAPADLRVLRRVVRDVRERGRTVEDVTRQYLETVRPMHDRYVEPTRAYADVVVANEGPQEKALEQLCRLLDRLSAGLSSGDLRADAGAKRSISG